MTTIERIAQVLGSQRRTNERCGTHASGDGGRRSCWSHAGAVALASTLLAAVAGAQAIENETMQVQAQGTPGLGGFGDVLRLRGVHLFVGCPSTSGIATNAGEVQYFRLALPTIPVQVIHGSDSGLGDAFGAAIALQGDRAVVGAPGHAHAGTATGSVYVFSFNGATWVQDAEIVPVDGAAGDEFGTSVDWSGDTIVVGARLKDEVLNPDEGVAYVYREVGGAWTLEQRLSAPDHATNESFGRNVAIDGDRLAVASEYGNGGSPTGLGAVFPYHRVGTTWTQDGRLVQPPSSGTYGTFGQGLDVQGDLVVVGHPYGSSPSGSFSGVVDVFRDVAGTWTLETILSPVFGYSLGGMTGAQLEIAGDRIVAGATWYSPFGFASGGAYVFQREGPTWATWSQPSVLVPRQSFSSHWFGRVVTFDGQRAVVSSNIHAYSNVYVFDVLRRVGDEYCFGDGSATPCPCGNASAVGAESGCANEVGNRGATLTTSGSTSVTANRLQASILGTGSNAEPMILFAGTARLNGGAGFAFGDGLRCAGGLVRRFPVQTAVSNFGISIYGPSLAAFGGWSAGDTRYFQAFYRSNGGPCGAGFNLSNAVEITFTP